MRILVSVLPALACLGMMLMMAIPMMRRKQTSDSTQAPSALPLPDEVSTLEADIAALEAKLALMESEKSESNN